MVTAQLQETNADSNSSKGKHLGFTTRFAIGMVSLLFRSAAEVLRIAAEIHHSFRDKPKLLDQTHEPSADEAPKLYRFFQMGLIHSSNQLHRLLDMLPDASLPNYELARLQSVINGVFGDKLHDWNHPATIEMHLLDQQGSETTLKKLHKKHPKGVVIFLHGLCLSENEWLNTNIGYFRKALKQEDIGAAFLRYNTGLNLSDNGKRLAQLINDQQSSEGRLIFIGHSMGGLVARSAIHYGETREQPWVRCVTHAAYVASPHEGARLERLGNLANSTLQVSPYTKPLMALGNIRSRGIRDLRHSHLIHDESSATFNENIEHLIIGARLPNPTSQKLLGDGLVCDKSSMGYAHFPTAHERIQRLIINDVGHMELLNDQRLTWALTFWLTGTKFT